MNPRLFPERGLLDTSLDGSSSCIVGTLIRKRYEMRAQLLAQVRAVVLGTPNLAGLTQTRKRLKRHFPVNAL
jgi:hypothetical protein